MNDALAAVVSQSQSNKVSTSSKARRFKSSAPKTWLEWMLAQKSLCVQLFVEGNYNHVVLHYGCRAPPLNTLCTWAGKVQEGEPLKGYGTNSVVSRTEEETILKFIKELKYETAVIDLDTIAALGRTVAEMSRAPGLARVLGRQWAANFRRRHKMGCLKKITTERLPSTVSDLALDNKWRREFLDLVEQPQKYGVRIPEGEPQSLLAWAQLGLDETAIQYAPKLRGGYAAGEKQVRHYNSADKRQATATPVVNPEGTVKVLQVLHRGKYKSLPCASRSASWPASLHARRPRGEDVSDWRHFQTRDDQGRHWSGEGQTRPWRRAELPVCRHHGLGWKPPRR